MCSPSSPPSTTTTTPTPAASIRWNLIQFSIVKLLLPSQVAREFSRRAQRDKSKKALPSFIKTNQEWLDSTKFDPTVCGGEEEEEEPAAMEVEENDNPAEGSGEEVFEEVQYDMEADQHQTNDGGGVIDCGIDDNDYVDEDDVFEPPIVEKRGRKRKKRAAPCKCKARTVKVARKAKKTFSQSRESWRGTMLARDVRRINRDPEYEARLLERLQERKRRRSSQLEERPPSLPYFDIKLSCLNMIKDSGSSMNGWDVIRLGVRDIHRRGGDVINLPSRKTLLAYKRALIPKGLEVTATMARIPLKNVLDHTAERLAVRPDLRPFFNSLPAGARPHLLWKWGVDGQSGADLCICVFLNLSFLINFSLCKNKSVSV